MKTLAQIMLSVCIFCIFYITVSAQNTTKLSDKFLIVLDIQEPFTTQTLDDTTSEKLIQNVNRVIEKFYPENVIYIESISRAISVSLRGIKVDTIPNTVLDKRLKIVNENIFSKSEQNAFTSAEVVNFMQKHNSKEIIVIGLAAEQCVYQTLIGGKELGYNMQTIPEAIVGKTSKGKEKAIRKMMKNGIKVLPINQLQ